MRRRWMVLILAVMAVALAVVGCGALGNAPWGPAETEYYGVRMTDAELQALFESGLLTAPGPLYCYLLQPRLFAPQRRVCFDTRGELEAFAARHDVVRAAVNGQPLSPTWTPSPTLTPSPTFTPSPTPLPGVTPAGGAAGPCAWQWATQPLDEVRLAAREALRAADYTILNVTVSVFGENCLDFSGQTPTVRYFAAMTTDFEVMVNVADVSDGAALGAAVETFHRLLSDFSQTAALPAGPGYLTLVFWQDARVTMRYRVAVRAMFSEITAALAAGLRGEALMRAIGPWPLIPEPVPT